MPQTGYLLADAVLSFRYSYVCDDYEIISSRLQSLLFNAFLGVENQRLNIAVFPETFL
jgi:hypothetical protein